MTPAMRILVTGEHDELLADAPVCLDGGKSIEWSQLPVLRYERLPLGRDLIESLAGNPVGWIVFTSRRAVRFWSETLLEHGIDFPLETQVACIGERTAETAAEDGFTPDFYPTEPGTEKFLEEFADLLSNNSHKPRVFIPMAEGGRPTLREELVKLGCEVIHVPLYRTVPREDIGSLLSDEALKGYGGFLFTSPSSVDAFLKAFTVPAGSRVVAIGKYTNDYLAEKGIPSRVLPEGDIHRIAEVLC